MQRVFTSTPPSIRVALSQSLIAGNKSYFQTLGSARTIGNHAKKPLPSAKNKGRNRPNTKRSMTGKVETPPIAPASEANSPFDKLERQLTSNFDEDVDYDLNNPSQTIVRESSTVTDVGAMAGSLASPDSQEPTSKKVLKFLTGEATDIGGGHENQDKSMYFRCGKNNEHLVLAVFDGHGRDLGELAAIIARDCMKEELARPETLDKIEANPQLTFDGLFEKAHIKIKDCFKERIEASSEYEVFETKEGFLVKRLRKSNGKGDNVRERDNYYQPMETNVHGGTTATVAVILNGKRLLVANVGDSTALFGGVGKEGRIRYQELSAEHSPESEEEFSRVVGFRESNALGKDGGLRFVYDVIDRSSSVTPKYSCPPIFEQDKKTGGVRRVNKTGHYYKNVRSEWATLVTTPPTARFQDALAFTRSLGDLHLHMYGVSHVPEVFEYDMEKLHSQVSGDKNCSLLLVCTDGVWDNWKYEDILSKVLSSSLIPHMASGSRSVQDLADEMMVENLRLARTYFGSQADNMTGIVCLIQSENLE